MKRDNPGFSKRQIMKHKWDPVISQMHPLINFGSISERMDEKLNNYIKNESLAQILESQGQRALKQKFKPIKGDTFKKMYFLKYMRSIVNPGENVGTIAAQSVGEPST